MLKNGNVAEKIKTCAAAIRPRKKQFFARGFRQNGWAKCPSMGARLIRRAQSSKQFPLAEHRRLTAGLAVLRQQIPHGCPRDTEAPATFGNAHTRIIVNESALRDRCKQSCAFLAVRRFRREPRRRAREFGPRHFPECERGGVAKVQNRVGLRAVRHDDEWRVENFLRQFRRWKIARQQVAPGPVPQAAREDLRLQDGETGWSGRIHRLRAMVNFSAVRGNRQFADWRRNFIWTSCAQQILRTTSGRQNTNPGRSESALRQNVSVRRRSAPARGGDELTRRGCRLRRRSFQPPARRPELPHRRRKLL